jgi:calcium-dependent protein kinase
MKNFMDAVAMKKTTLTYLAQKLPEKYVEDLRRIFISIDSNGDGKIEHKEFSQALMRVGADFTCEEINELMDTLDTNKNGFIDYTEFLAGCMRSKLYLEEDHLRSAFEYFDIVSCLC